jgi:ATP-dependent helicase/nuclease subunit A
MVRHANGPMIDAATRRAQAEASDPRASAWVSANAGSGKTFVLARRVVRLLLAGTDPGRILCLTFTKAAAAEMAKRVFERLGEWVVLSDRELSRAIEDIEGHRPNKDELNRARRLFARALETPGGLKIQTIHAFCERLLQQFPFEANVAGHFEVLDEREASDLREEARRSVVAEAADDTGVLGAALATVLAAGSDMAHEQAVKEFVEQRARILGWIHAAGSLDQALRQVQDRLGLTATDTPERLRLAVVSESAFAHADFVRLIGLLRAGGKNDKIAAERLAPYLDAIDDDARAAAYQAFCTKADGELRDAEKIVTKAVKGRWDGLAETIEAELARLKNLFDRLAAADCYATTAAMLRLADATIAAYQRRKTSRGALDFDDLILKTTTLFARSDAAQWVHYKLDRGIEHILVDEAQDTSPRQWHVVKALVEEFFAGEGAVGATRTLFAVGDQKQSIFSFQGAVPAWFSLMRRELGGRARAAEAAWFDPELHLSFRSVQAVLAAVDSVFAQPSAYRALSDSNEPPVHSAVRHGVPGRVVLWPMIEPTDKAEPEDWAEPLDHLSEADPEVTLANRLARTIGRWLHGGEKLDSGGPVRAGGILILCRTRGAQTDAINRALKSNGIPIAGADRLYLTEHIAVMDLMALGRVALLPEDDLSLAALLKSPLIGLSEEALFDLAHGRHGSLWDALGRQAQDRPDFAAARAAIERWRAAADRRKPYGFFARILGPERGRKRFLQRLGAEAEDVLDEFLNQTLAYEHLEPPTLQGFLAWLDAGTSEIKRDTETLRDEVRVMTVHGAKGLEADIVFVVDNGSVPVHPSHDARVVALDDDRDGTASPLVWMRRFKAMPASVQTRVKALRAQAQEEYLRLLYVAMTRAKDRLYICGTRKKNSDRVNGWHGLVTSALEAECVPRQDADGVEELEWRPAERQAQKTRPPQPVLPLGPSRPDWLERDAPPPPPEPARLTPSTVLGEDGEAPAFRPSPSGDIALMRGRLIHRLLESLPAIAESDRDAIGAAYLDAFAQDLPDEERAALLAEVLTVMAEPTFAPVFAEGSRAEVEIVGRIDRASGEATVSGRVDRLAVTPTRVLIVDYKTNRPAPDVPDAVPPGYIAQLALYRVLLRRLYPGREVEAALLWTDVPALMAIPAEVLDSAEAAVLAG